MPGTVQFVDSISASPATLLDLNNPAGVSALSVDEQGIDLSPPPLRRAVASTMMTDGEHVTGAVFEDRAIKCKLNITRPAGSDAAATIVQNLSRELNRETNLLKVQLTGMSSPVFFQTKRASSYVLSMLRMLLTENATAQLEIPAEPYALGLEESLGTITVNNDPAAGTNPLRFDVAAASVKGDAPTPLYIRTTSSLAGATILLATRRRGAPASGVYFVQAENATNGTDTADQADANASGGNEVRTTFATQTGYADRITATLPSATAGADLRGQYRVFVRHQKSATGSVMRGRLRVAGVIDGPEVTIPDSTTYQLVDYGLLQIPFGSDKDRDGYGAALAAGGVSCAVRLSRPSGSGSADSDYILTLPADAEFAVVSWPANPVGPQWVFDGPNDDVYWRGTAGTTHNVGASGGLFPSCSGGLPMVSPNQDNRVFFVSVAGAITASYALTVSYWPRYLTVRPAST
jgi:hypothetical protein